MLESDSLQWEREIRLSFRIFLIRTRRDQSQSDPVVMFRVTCRAHHCSLDKFGKRLIARTVTIEVRFPNLFEHFLERSQNRFPNAGSFCVRHVRGKHAPHRFTGGKED
jgi:hypothetical protein